MVEREDAGREQDGQRRDALREAPAAEFAGEESGEKHGGGAGERRWQADSGKRITEKRAGDSRDQRDEWRLVDIAPGEVPPAIEVVELVDEKAVLPAGVEVQGECGGGGDGHQRSRAQKPGFRGVRRGGQSDIVCRGDRKLREIRLYAAQLIAGDCSKRGEIVLDGPPDERLIHGVILVPEDVSGGGNGRPIDIRMPLKELLREPTGRLGNDLQCAHDGVNRPWVGAESRRSSSAVKLRMASMLATMSRSRWAGFLEGMNGVVQDVGAQEGLERPSVNDIARALEELVDE